MKGGNTNPIQKGLKARHMSTRGERNEPWDEKQQAISNKQKT